MDPHLRDCAAFVDESPLIVLNQHVEPVSGTTLVSAVSQDWRDHRVLRPFSSAPVTSLRRPALHSCTDLSFNEWAV